MFISENIVSLLIGIGGGIITAFLLWLTTLFSKKVVLPWFQELVYRGVNVGGNWIYAKKDSESSDIEITMDLSQRAHEIFGTFCARSKKSTKEYSNYYKLKGFVKDNYLLFTYSAQRKDRTGVGAFLLRVSHGGTELIGNATYTPDGDADDSEVVCRTKMVFKRI